jgi:hypothetical protein
MRSNKFNQFSLLIALAIVVAITAAMSFGHDGTSDMYASQEKGKSQEDQIPVAIFAASETDNLAERNQRRVKNRRYDNRRPQPIHELEDDVEELPLITHWEWKISAIPSAQSDVIAIGEVADAQAYLSNDKTGVYSEFTILLKEVLKNGTSAPLKSDDSIVAEREGGAVRFPSGRVQRYRIANQGMPRKGQAHVFFLKRNDLEQGFSIITAYQLRDGRVVPLDTGAKFSVYKGAEEEAFLGAVRVSLKGGRGQ